MVSLLRSSTLSQQRVTRFHRFLGRPSACFDRTIGSLVCLLFAAAFSVSAEAATCTTTGAGTNWNVAANWSNCAGGNGPAANTPGSNDTAIIATGHTMSNNVTVTVGAVTVNAGAVLNVAGNNFTVNGATVISGTLNHTNTGGTPIFVGLVTVNSGGTWNNNISEAVTFRGGITNNGTWIGGSGTHTFNTNSQVITASAPMPFGGNWTVSSSLTLAGSAAIAIGGSVTLANGVSVTNNNTNTVTVNGTLNGSGGGGSTSRWTNGPGSTLSYGTGTNPPMNTGILDAGTHINTIDYARSGNQNVKATPHHHITLSGSGTKTIPGIAIAGNLTVEGTATASPSTGLTIEGSMLLNGGTFSAGNLTHSVGGNFTLAGGTFTQAGSTLVMNGTAAQSVSGTPTFNNLTVANTSAVVSILGNSNVNSNLTVEAGAVLQPAAAVLVGGTGTLSGSGTVRVTRTTGTNNFLDQYTISGKSLTDLTVEYAGAGAQTVSATTYGGVTINNAAGTTLAAGTTTINGTLTLASGGLAVGARTLLLNGPPIAGTTSGFTTTSTSVLGFGGTASGVFLPATATQLNRLTLDNPNGLDLSASLSSDSVILTSGVVRAGAGVLTVAGTCTGSVTRTAGFVEGQVRLNFPAASATCTFPVGTGSAYAPITLFKPATGAAGALTGSTTGNEHPSIATEMIDPTKNVNRHWTLTNDTINSSTYGVTLGFTAGDIDVGASTSTFVVGRHSGSSWTATTVGTRTATSTATANNGVAGPLSGISFAVGEEAFVCTTPSDLPPSMSCVCDNFGRSSVNPSSIFGGNWSLASISGNFGVPKIINSGYLRMTNSSTEVSTAATMPGTFPAAGNLITVDFRLYAYNGNGADGVALTLSDASIPPVPGSFGGSLGYAQRTNPNQVGFAGGWIGVGFDEYGNYSSASEGRVGGPGFRSQAVAVRGSGSGLTGYPYLAGTASLNPTIDSAGSATPAPGHAYRVMVDARCYERNTANSEITCGNASLSRRTQVSVFRDVTGAGNFSTANRLINFDAYAINPSQASVPQHWKLSFTGSTGAQYNIHEIQGLKICAQFITPPAGYRIQVDNATPSTCGTPGGSPSSPIVTVTALDTNGNAILDYNKTITLSATLQGGGASSATWRKVGAATNLAGNQYTFVPADQGVAQFYLTNASPQTVYITVNENGGTLSSSLAEPVVYSGGAFDITNIDPLGAQAGGGVVAGRGHLMQVTRRNGCSIDTTYTGMRNLDGWYTPVAAEHPTGATAPRICQPNASNTCLPDTGACHTLSIAPPNIDGNSNFIPPLDFAAGVARFCLATSDVGKYSLSLRDDTSTPVTGSTTTLTARPYAIVVSGIKQGTTLNNATGTAADPLFAVAGSSFEASVGGYLYSINTDLNNDGLPDAGFSLAQMTAAGLAPRYGDIVFLSATDSAGGATPKITGTLSGGSVVVVSGSGSGVATGLIYPEVGSFQLAAQPHTNYLGSGVNLTPRVLIYARSATNIAPNNWVGRFRPHRFTLLGGLLTNRATASCVPASSFTYMGEPLGVSFQLEARNLAGDITRNYAGAWAKLTAPNWLQLGGAGESMGLGMNATGFAIPGPHSCNVTFGAPNTTFACTGGTPPAAVPRSAGPRVALANTPSAVNWSNGVSGTFSAQAVLHRADELDGPYTTVNVGVAPRDSEGTTLSVFDMDADFNSANERARIGTTAMRFGRLSLLNGVGSDRLPLPLSLAAEYWNGAGFQVNEADSCTRIAPENIAVIGYAGDITSANFGGAILPSSPITLAQGRGRVVLARPNTSVGVRGSAAICVDLDAEPTPLSPVCAATTSLGAPWLQGRWGGPPAFDDDPRARATFGVARDGPIIYMRERY